MKKWLFSIGFVIIVMAALIINNSADISYASRLTNDLIRGMESEISNTQQERNKLRNTLSNVQSIKQNLMNSRNDLARFIQELDENLEIIEANITELLGLIERKEIEIDEKTLELYEALDTQQAQYEGMKERVKFLYEQGNTYYLDLIFSSENISDMQNRADFIEELSKFDENKLNEYIAFSEYVELCKEALEEEKIFLDEAKQAVEDERAAVNALIAEKTAQIESIRGDIALQDQAIREYEADIAAQNEIIQALERAVANERARLAAEHARRYDGGKFAWPVPASKRVTDEYGDRIHPILRVPQFHSGIDIGAPTGTDIVAAYQGRVAAAAYSATMGNYIMIDHGDSVFTIYRHASKLFVKEGDEVTKGQKIAAVGSTGRSTGPHLCFSVRVGGQFVSPWGYLGS